MREHARERALATCRATLHTEEMLDVHARMRFDSRNANTAMRQSRGATEFAYRFRRTAPNRSHGLHRCNMQHPEGRHDRGIRGREVHGRCRLRVRRELRNLAHIASGVLLPRNKPGKVVPVPPAKKSTRKAAAKRKAPAKRKAARKTPAKRKAPAKRKVQPRKAAKRKAPAKRKAAKKATKRKAPAKRKAAKKRPRSARRPSARLRPSARQRRSAREAQGSEAQGSGQAQGGQEAPREAQGGQAALTSLSGSQHCWIRGGLRASPNRVRAGAVRDRLEVGHEVERFGEPPGPSLPRRRARWPRCGPSNAAMPSRSAGVPTSMPIVERHWLRCSSSAAILCGDERVDRLDVVGLVRPRTAAARRGGGAHRRARGRSAGRARRRCRRPSASPA